VLGGILGVSALAWAYLVYLRVDMQSAGMGTDMAMQRAQAWTAVDLALLLSMWAVMMVAMMLPTATTTSLAFAAITRGRRARDRPYVPTAVFLGG
jgi:predicted metal-binding membrane protein